MALGKVNLSSGVNFQPQIFCTGHPVQAVFPSSNTKTILFVYSYGFQSTASVLVYLQIHNN